MKIAKHENSAQKQIYFIFLLLYQETAEMLRLDGSKTWKLRKAEKKYLESRYVMLYENGEDQMAG